MKVRKIERVVVFEDGSERRSTVAMSDEGVLAKPELPRNASKEWDKIMKWMSNKGLESIIDGVALRDHCLSVEEDDSDRGKGRSFIKI